MPPERISLMRPDLGQDEIDAVARVIRSGWLVQGKEVEAFEQSVAALHQVAHGVAVSSATAGLHVALAALGVEAGDEVFIPSFAWPSAANMTALCGATPVFVDVDPATYNMCPGDLSAKIRASRARRATPRGIVVVHEFGLPADMAAIGALAKSERLWILEDAACALGARTPEGPVGSLGQLGVFSFHPRKSLTTGEGGCVVTNDPDLAGQLRSLRNHGQAIIHGKRDFACPGWNYRLTELQAAMGNTQLQRFETILQHRRRIATCYQEHLDGVAGLTLPPLDPAHTWQTYMPVLDETIDREGVIRRMGELNIECNMGAFAAHLLGPFRTPDDGKSPDACPVSTRLFAQGLALPLHSFLDENDIRTVSEALRRCLREP